MFRSHTCFYDKVNELKKFRLFYIKKYDLWEMDVKKCAIASHTHQLELPENGCCGMINGKPAKPASV